MSLTPILVDKLEYPSSLYGYNPILDEYRDKIYQISSDNWKKIRFYINPYDFVNVTFKNLTIINRAFYKYWEIVHTFKLLEPLNSQDSIFHCAEAPGGFIQGTQLFFQKRNIPDKDGFLNVKKGIPSIFTMSIVKKNHYYDKSILKKNITILYGKDSNGDITSLNNIKNLGNTLKKIAFITADGGFDEGHMYNMKEQLHYNLIFHEVLAALTLQKKGGCFLLKVFDIYTTTSIHILYLLFTNYHEFYIYKPKTSRPTNSEKYIVCKNFKGISQSDLDILYTFSTIINSIATKTYQYSFTLFKDIDKSFINKIKSTNDLFLSIQCEYLKKGIYSVQKCEKKTYWESWKNEYDFCFT